MTRIVAGRDRVHYTFDAGTPTANLLTLKPLINSMILTPGARFFMMDIKNFYLSKQAAPTEKKCKNAFSFWITRHCRKMP
jgi:hypothetical protein